jgi:hypothetical protein
MFFLILREKIHLKQTNLMQVMETGLGSCKLGENHAEEKGLYHFLQCILGIQLVTNAQLG